MPQPRVSIRLGLEGQSQVTQGITAIGDAGSVQAQRYQAAWERASSEAERALDKQAKAAQRLAAVGPSTSGASNLINPTTGGSYAQADGAAQASARAIQQQMAAGEQSAQRLLASIDPLYAAQLRYDQALAEANTLQRQGSLTTEQMAVVQTGLKAQLDGTTALYGKMGGGIGNTRIAQMELMHVVRGSVDQFAAGAPPMQIFTMHLGMLGQAAALSGESMGKFGAFMASGWGLALTVAVVALGPLITKLFDTKKGVEDLVDKLKKEAEQQAANDNAHRVFAHTLEAVIDALRRNREALDHLAEGERNAAEHAADQAFASIRFLKQHRDETAALIVQTKAQLELNSALAGLEHVKGTADPRLVAASAASARVQSLQDDLKKTDAAITDAQKQATDALSHVTVDRASASEVDKIKRLYEGRGGLIEQARLRAVAEHATTAELTRQVQLLKDAEAAKIKAVQERGRKGPNIENEGGAAIETAQLAAFLDIANRYRGKSETGDKAVLESFFRAANENLDPEKTAWCAAFVNAVLATGGVKGTGSLAAKSFLGFGKDDRSSPQKGDIVIVRSGGSPSGMHVGFLDSIDAKGNVGVLGGNTGNKVATSTFAATNVLGIRRPPTPAESYAGDVKAAEDAADAAVKEYLEHLKKIVPDQLAAAAKPIKEAIDAVTEVKKLNEQHEETMTLLTSELSLTGLTADKREEILKILQYEMDLRRKFPGMTQQQIDLLVAQEKAEKGLRAELDKTEARMEEFQRVGEDIVDTVFNPDNWRNWGDAGLKVLREILDLWLQMSLINPLKNKMFGTSLPSFGSNVGASDLFGFLGSLLGGSSSAGVASAADSAFVTGFTGFPGLATGTENFPGGLAWVGEFGKELLHLPRGSRITPAAESRRLEAANDTARLVPVGDTYHIGVSVAGGGSRSENRETGMQIGGAIRQKLAVTSRKGLMGRSSN